MRLEVAAWAARDPSWHAVGTGDFYDNGYSDILWQNDSGAVAIWEMNGTNFIGGGSAGNAGPTWHAVGTGDFNPDRFADLLWQNDSGAAAIWEMQGTNVIGGGSLADPGPTCHV
jgi:serralysin